MRKLSPNELKRMKGTHHEAMLDRVTRLVYTEGVVDVYNKPAVSYVAGESLACGYEANTSTEVMDGAEAAVFDATLRLQRDVILDRRDRFSLTVLKHVTLNPALLFEIVGDPLRGPTATRVRVRLITNG